MATEESKISKKSQQRFRQKSKVTSQARVNSQADRVRHSRGTGRLQVKIQESKNRQRDGYTGRQGEYRQQYKGTWVEDSKNSVTAKQRESGN